MKSIICKLCNSNKKSLIWNDTIRSGKGKFTKKKYKIFNCLSCNVKYLEKTNKKLLNNVVFRKKFDGSNSVKKYHDFNKPRELRKIKFIEKFISFKRKDVLETNCGAASNLDYIVKKARSTSGQDNKIYQAHVSKKHNFFSSLENLIVEKKKFDLILSLAELEHRDDPIKFVKDLTKILKKNGKIVFRIPNFYNLYYLFLGSDFQRFDFRESHNFYFCEKSINFLFKKLNLKVRLIKGFNEYDINHFIQFLKTKKRVETKYKKIIKSKNSQNIVNKINSNLLSTSFIYVVSK